MPVILTPEERAMNVVIEAIKDRFDPEPVPCELTSETSLNDDLGFDSLDLVELEMELGEELDLKIPDDFLEGTQTVGEAVLRVSRLLMSQEE